ncbi:2',3'-cyclic-nucleotide 3'-phosphodiesterase [Leucosporidium creatinivorum]|uniref:2',3'-cyclic-nucleotide 3'-phosphodiesterase n=1 Tax=Leucosporidium creatinivorum TaxID=106004 RepID=A0A1Y2EHH7_9BASI|nr:2',3'-cyclic-nucleotide 3'-phosphodiesterase [Leucosporidium creatinivorum]
MGIALWLAPSPSSSADTSLRSLLDKLSTAHSTPPFDPHVTLLTGIPTGAPLEPLLQQLESAVQDAEPLKLQYKELGTHGTFFQYLFVAVEKSEELKELRSRVRTACLPPNVSATADDYFPHLSLMYGEDTETRKVADVIGELKNEGGEEVRSGGGFAVDEVLLVSCEGPPKEWMVLGRVKLQS